MISDRNDRPFWAQKKIEGHYANHFKIGHNAYEFVLDFGQYYSETGKARLCARIITNPCYAKSLYDTLRESIERYEEAFGPIQEE